MSSTRKDGGFRGEEGGQAKRASLGEEGESMKGASEHSGSLEGPGKSRLYSKYGPT